MPINFTPRKPNQNSMPGRGVIKDAWRRQLAAMGKSTRNVSNFGQFEEGQNIKVEGGRVETNVNEIASNVIRFPAHALEAPFRPLNVATGGGFGKAVGNVWGVTANIPVLGSPLKAVEGAGGLLEASNKAGRAFMNQSLATALAAVRGKSDNFVYESFGDKKTAREIRDMALSRWSMDDEGNEYDLRALESRAAKDNWSFGEFNVDDDGFTNFVAQMVMDPLNLAFIGGGSALKLAKIGIKSYQEITGAVKAGKAVVGHSGAAIQAATWASPAVNLGTRALSAPRIGYGMLKSVGRVTTASKGGQKFVDQYASAKAIMEGQLVQHGTLAGALRMSATVAKGVYLPGYRANRALGASKIGAGAKAYTRGGIQQSAVTTLAEHATAAPGYLKDQENDNVIHDGFTGWIHDALYKVNNDHPFSDNESFMVMALFSPWASGLGDIRRATKQAQTNRGLPVYADSVLREVKEAMRKRYGIAETYESLLTKIGRGDMAEGKRIFEWFVDQAEVMKISNQLTHFTRKTAEITDIAQRGKFLQKLAQNKVLEQRGKGALQPRSTSDFMLDLIQSGPLSKTGEAVEASLTITPELFYKKIGDIHGINQTMAPQLEKLAGIVLEQGAPVTKELLEGLVAQLDNLADDLIVPKDIAGRIMSDGSSLIWDSDFFMRMAYTLGQKQFSGKFKRAATEGENVTVGTLREKLTSLVDEASGVKELFHEEVAAASKVTKIKPGDFLQEPPYPLPKKLEARRVYNTGRVKHLVTVQNRVRELRNLEFFKNGKARIQSAKELTGRDGGKFVRKDVGPSTSTGPTYNAKGELVLDTSKPFAKTRVDEANAPNADSLRGIPDGKPDSMTYDDLGVSKQVFYYGPDGKPIAYAKVLHRDFGNPANPGPIENVSVYVDPAFRRKGIATKMYDELVNQGVDITKITGRSTTVSGEALSKSYLARRGNTFVRESDGMALTVEDGVISMQTPGFPYSVDAETLMLGVENGGRVVVMPRAEGKFLAEHGFVETAVIESGATKAIRRPAADDTITLENYGFVSASRQSNATPHLDRTFKEVVEPSANPATLYRSISTTRAETLKSMAGKEVKWPGYMSTATTKDLTLPYQPKGSPVVRVEVPNGIKSLDMDAALESWPGGMPALKKARENGFKTGEILLEKDLKFKVTLEGDEIVLTVVRNTDSNLAAFAYKGGNPLKLMESRAAGDLLAYKPTQKTAASRESAITKAQKAADNASLVEPNMASVGEAATKLSRRMSNEERLKELNRLEATADAERRALMKQISESDRIAMELVGIDTNVSKLGDWFNQASKGEIDNALALIKNVSEDFPGFTAREGQGIWIDPRADRFSMLLQQRSLMKRLAFDYGHLSPISFIYDALLKPIHSRLLGSEAGDMIHQLLAESGFSVAETKKFAADMRAELIGSRSATGLGEYAGSHLYRSLRAIPEGKTRNLLEAAAPGKSAEVIERWGSVQKMMTEASNRLMRHSSKMANAGVIDNPLIAGLNASYRVWQYGKGFSTISDVTHMATKFIYPLFRFGMDPFYHAMNALEPHVQGIAREGKQATRFGKRLVPEEQSARAAEHSSVTSIPPGGLRTDETPIDLLLSDQGAFTMPRNIRPTLERHFDINRFDSTGKAFKALKDEDPLAIFFREKFGDDRQDWVKAADELMYGYMTQGPEKTVIASAKAMFDDMGITAVEARQIAPFVERLATMHRGQYNDLVQLYVGRMNRANLERVMDHFFLFWPLSYQIKATQWMAGLMFQRLGGMNTGAGGAYLYKEYRDRWTEEVENDPGLRTWMDDHSNFTFLLEMMFPMTPEGVGVSLSRPTKYVGQLIDMPIPDDLKETIFGDNDNINTLGDVVDNSTTVGPARSWKLTKRILDEFDFFGFNTDETPEDFQVRLPGRFGQ